MVDDVGHGRRVTRRRFLKTEHRRDKGPLGCAAGRGRTHRGPLRTDLKGKVKLKETPILAWSWKVVTLPTAPQGLFVKSEKTGTVTYVIVRSGSADLGRWLTERRNVVEDYRKIYGEEPDNPAVSIAIDSDDTSSTAESFFGAIVFRKP